MPDPIEAWVDSAELRRMGEQLLHGRTDGGGQLRNVSPDPRPRAAPEAERAGQHLANARALADRSGVLSAQAPPEAPAVDSQRSSGRPALGPGPLLGRLTAYRDWLHDEVGIQAFFLLQADGEPMADETGHEGLRQLALRVARSAAMSGGLDEVGGSLRVQVSAEQQLEVIPAETPLGPLILGLVITRALSRAAVETVAEGLNRAVAPAPTPSNPFESKA